MALSQHFFVLYTILQILQCHNCSNLEKPFIENQTSDKKLSPKKLHVFAEKFKPFLFESDHDNNHTFIGINYFLIKTIGEHLNMGIAFKLASNENRLKYWKPSSKQAFD